jgi:hypothetical protein
VNLATLAWLCDASLWLLLDWLDPRVEPVPAYTTTTGEHRQARP